MEVAKVEMAAVEVVAQTNDRSSLLELTDLQIALVGGGVGEVILA